MKPKAISPTVWKEMWAELKQQSTVGLMAYAVICDDTQKRWREQHPGLDFSNARYCSHLEDVLRKGGDVPDEFVQAVSNDDIRYDWPCFPLLRARMH